MANHIPLGLLAALMLSATSIPAGAQATAPTQPRDYNAPSSLPPENVPVIPPQSVPIPPPETVPVLPPPAEIPAAGSPMGQPATAVPDSAQPALSTCGDASAKNPVTPAPREVVDAQYGGGPLPDGLCALTLKVQIILDQLGMSPGVIDGIKGGNLSKAIAAAEQLAGLPVDGVLDPDLWARLPKDVPVLGDYEITDKDIAGPYLASVPSDYAEMARLDSVAYTGPIEMLAERFHMDENLLTALNPNANFNVAGTHILVAFTHQHSVETPVASLVADKATAQLRGYDETGKLVVSYPATIGSDDLPSPSGTHTIKGIATDAAYYYNPDLNFKQGNNTRKLKIPPGPNNPIGTTWIDLSKPTYGIHGTPWPAKIDKTRSHGCIRLTNWDAEELASLVKKGVTVEFRD